MLLFYILLMALSPALSPALLGFDCGGQHLNFTSISLLDSGDCDLRIHPTNSMETYIQLLQLSDYNYAEVIQCKIEVIRMIYYCTMHSHISAVQDGEASYLEVMGSDRCNEMHKTGSTTIATTNYIVGLKVNQTNIRNITIVGKLGNDGVCSGDSYNNPFGNWENVVIQDIVKITLKSSYVPVHLNSGKIYLKSGTACDFREGSCLDLDDGYTFWKPIPTTSCDFHQYDVLYEGNAKKTKDDSSGSSSPVIYSLITQDIMFAFMVTKEIQHCGYTLLRTEHPKLFIVETRKGNEIKLRGETSVDIFSYVNSKFVYVEKYIHIQMTSLYYNVIKQRCELEKEDLKNIFSLATLLPPDEFAYQLMKKPGYMTVSAGEAMYIIQCIPVDVIVRQTKECYNELPILFRNSTLFLTPKSRIITKFGTQKECSYELPTLYRIENTWIQLPELYVHHTPPQQLQPLTKITWKYLIPRSLVTSGIYTQEDINKLRDHIMFPVEKLALLNSVAREIMGYSTSTHPGSMYNLLSENDLNKSAENTAAKIWDGFIAFGSATAGILGIFIIIRIIKIIIDSAIHGYVLYTVYGCSLHLLEAIWSSLTSSCPWTTRKLEQDNAGPKH